MSGQVDGEFGFTARRSGTDDLLHLVLGLQRRQQGGCDAQPLQNDGELHHQRLDEAGFAAVFRHWRRFFRRRVQQVSSVERIVHFIRNRANGQLNKQTKKKNQKMYISIINQKEL